MAEGYAIVKALGFCTEYMQEYTSSIQRVWDDKEDPSMYDEILEGNKRARQLSPDLQGWIHEFELFGEQCRTIGRLEEVSSHQYDCKQYDCNFMH